MNNEEAVRELEHRLGFTLPNDYRGFLISHKVSFLDASLVFRSPQSGLIDQLLTVGEILRNAEEQRIGIPERSLLHIGGDFMGGYLYLRVSQDGFGEIHYSERMIIRKVFDSFDEFLASTEEEA